MKATPKPAAVRAWTENVVIPSYLPAAPDRNPMFLEKRVYQGSSGKVYPLQFTDRINETKVDRTWKVVWIENEFIRVMILPELGGRIHRAVDKTNGYDFIYHQPVIKPALVGLSGPWISGGIEFNWPQHHRPATFLPVEFEIERAADGAKTVWCSDHDPMARMKGMHGVCLRPGVAAVELKVRAYNRTPLVQTFLWWANVATRVHEGYQSFFPPDVYYVADHARRATSRYPWSDGSYYGIDYAARARRGTPAAERPPKYQPPHCAEVSTAAGAGLRYAANDLSWYANICTPCSYMCMGSAQDFFGGYDHFAGAGLIHVANHHVSPGKKQWTWGNHPFGYAWDRNLTDATAEGEFAPYIELMAGVYTDNQPDFSFLQPGETKTWTQTWYPVQKIGPAQQANRDAAISLQLEKNDFRIGVSVPRAIPGARIRLEQDGRSAEWRADVAPGKPFVIKQRQPRKPWRVNETILRVVAHGADGPDEIISYAPRRAKEQPVPPPAMEPACPREISSADELYLTGVHLEQYRHATRSPTAYWLEALRRDPLDSRCNNAIGLWHLRRGEFDLAEVHFRKAIERLTRRNANPRDGEPYYNLGLCLRYQAAARGPESSRKQEEAYGAFYKATWNQAWCAAGFHALAEIDCARGEWALGLDHVDRSLRFDVDNLRARNLKVLILRKAGRAKEATEVLRSTRKLDRLDIWARHLDGERPSWDLQAALDVAHDFARAGFFENAIALLEQSLKSAKQREKSLGGNGVAVLPDQSWGAEPLVHYTLGWLHERAGDERAARAAYRSGAAAAPDYCFPARLEEVAILESAMRAHAGDARAPYYLGNLFYDRRRHREAIRLWERSAKLDAGFSVVWRNLGIGHFNILRRGALARRAYDNAFQANPADARLLFERDQLRERLGESPTRRLRELERNADLVCQRDDLTVELCALYNQVGRHAEAAALLAGRHFQPWEGGEGEALGQHVRTQLALGKEALRRRELLRAAAHFESALDSPLNLGEAKHILANQSDIHYWLGCAYEALRDLAKAREHWRAAATFKGDFQQMVVRAFSEMTYYSALSFQKLGRAAAAKKLFRQLLAYARDLATRPPGIDYFATSLPTMLLFEEDLNERQGTTARFLEAQARLGLGQRKRARSLLGIVLKRDPNHARAADLMAEF